MRGRRVKVNVRIIVVLILISVLFNANVLQ